MPHLPRAGRPVPVSTYRVQLTPQFGFRDAAAVVPYLAELGVTHLYCSPWLQAAPGSLHGYDVVDHSQLNAELGDAAAFDELVAACRRADLGIVLDIVPNHMAISEPESQNAAWWSLLREGPDSAYASWFDVDWSAGKVVVPVLGSPLADSMADLRVDGDRIRYYDHELPLAPGSVVAGDLPATLDAQHWRLAYWRVGAEELSHRRFFDVTTLAGLRVEDPAVFQATHELIIRQVREGVVDGLRVDHPDGLADPEEYLLQLCEATGGSWVVAEKILEPGEDLPDSWPCVGTTGYDTLNRVLGLFVDPAGEQPLTDLWQSVTGRTASYGMSVDRAKRQVVDQLLAAEVERLVEVGLRAVRAARLDVTRRGLREALVEVLVAFEVYRAYLPAGGPADATARARVQLALRSATAACPRRSREIAAVGRLALAELDCPEFVIRFQQTCGPVMAKGVEDTAFYRFLRLSALCEVGGDPGRFGIPVEEFHRACAAQQRDWPVSMTTLSTHDTKRSEDVRARLVLLSQLPHAWGEAVTEWSALAAPHRSPDAAVEQLVWQTLVGAWPISADRAVAYFEKATREAKDRTSWTDPDPAFDEALAAYVRAVLADERLTSSITAFVAELDPAWQRTVLAQKLVQLTMPGVPDTYQGTECTDLSLVDPDNRRPVDYERRRALLVAPDNSLDARKLQLVAEVLRLRRAQPAWFGAEASYDAIDSPAEVLAFCRSGQVIVVAGLRGTRPPTGLLALPEGGWRDLVGGGTHEGALSLDGLRDGIAALVADVDAGAP